MEYVDSVGTKIGEITCDSYLVTQELIEKSFRVARQVNNLTSPHQKLYLWGFNLGHSLLTQLDLTPLLNVKMEHLGIHSNNNLSNLVGPPLDSNLELIEVKELFLDSNPALTDSSLNSMLKYFNPDELTIFYLDGNSLTGDLNSNSEFLPGLSAFTNLNSLVLSDNKIQRLSGAPFKKNNKLTNLDLWDNLIEYLGENTFEFDEPPTELTNKTLADNPTIRILLKIIFIQIPDWIGFKDQLY